MSEKQEDKEQRKQRGDRWFLLAILIVFLVGLSIRGYSYITGTTGQKKAFRQGVYQNQKSFPYTLRDG
jgi:hypothetical protein